MTNTPTEAAKAAHGSEATTAALIAEAREAALIEMADLSRDLGAKIPFLLTRLAEALEAATQWTMLAHTDEEFARLYDMERILVAIEVQNRASGTACWQIDTVSFDDETGEIVEDTGWTLRDYTWWRPLPAPPGLENPQPPQGSET